MLDSVPSFVSKQTPVPTPSRLPMSIRSNIPFAQSDKLRIKIAQSRRRGSTSRNSRPLCVIHLSTAIQFSVIMKTRSRTSPQCYESLLAHSRQELTSACTFARLLLFSLFAIQRGNIVAKTGSHRTNQLAMQFARTKRTVSPCGARDITHKAFRVVFCTVSTARQRAYTLSVETVLESVSSFVTQQKPVPLPHRTRAHSKALLNLPSLAKPC